MPEAPGLQMFGTDSAVCVDGVCHVPEGELQALGGESGQADPADRDTNPS